MGSGKTTIGKKLAEIFNLKFLDTDKIIEKKNRMTINQIFNKHGEKYFRNEEKKIITDLKKHKNSIISTGGGFVCYNNIMNIINQDYITIYLKYSSEILYERLKKEKEKEKRPILKNIKKKELKYFITNLLSNREKYYEKSKVIIECTNLNDQKILRKINSMIIAR